MDEDHGLARAVLAQSLIRPSSPPVATRPSARTARDKADSSLVIVTGFVRSSFGQSLIVPSRLPLASHPFRNVVRPRAILRTELDRAVVAATSQPPVLQHRQG